MFKNKDDRTEFNKMVDVIMASGKTFGQARRSIGCGTVVCDGVNEWLGYLEDLGLDMEDLASEYGGIDGMAESVLRGEVAGTGVVEMDGKTYVIEYEDGRVID